MHNSTPEGGRKRRQLADGRISRGYESMEVEAIEAPISAEALGLLMRIREDSSQREKDGDIDGLALQAVAVYCKIAKARLPRLLAELKGEDLIELLPGGGVRDLNYPTWSRTRDEREGQRERWRDRKQRSRQGDRDEGADAPATSPSQRDNHKVTRMSRRDMPESHADVPPGVTGMSSTAEAEAEAEAEIDIRASGLRPSAPPKPPGGGPADGLSTEPDDVRAYGERFIQHGRTPSGEDLEVLRRVPFEYDRLARDVILAAIDDTAARHLAQGKPMPKARYLVGKLGDLQAAASDAGVRPRAPASQGRGAGGLTRLSNILPGAAAG